MVSFIVTVLSGSHARHVVESSLYCLVDPDCVEFLLFATVLDGQVSDVMPSKGTINVCCCQSPRLATWSVLLPAMMLAYLLVLYVLLFQVMFCRSVVMYHHVDVDRVMLAEPTFSRFQLIHCRLGLTS